MIYVGGLRERTYAHTFVEYHGLLRGCQNVIATVFETTNVWIF